MIPCLTRVGSAFALLCLLLAGSVSAEVTKPEKRLGRPLRRPTRYNAEASPTLPRYILNTNLGITVSQGSALAASMQFGFNLFPAHRLYLGPELNFSLYSPGSVLGTLVDVWYEFYVQTRLSLSGGVAAGPAFSTQIPTLSTTSLMLLGELTISQELDDLVSIRGQLRPGIFERQFALQICFSLSFRFY